MTKQKETPQSNQSVANSQVAVIAAADDAAIMSRLSHDGNPATHHAAGIIQRITDMHNRNNYSRGEELQLANDALFYLPMTEIQRLCAAYEAKRGR